MQSLIRQFRRIVVAACTVTTLAGLSGCQTLSDTRTPVVKEYAKRRQGTMLPIQRVVTDFDTPLRCMDEMLETYGASASLQVEDLSDKTAKVSAGTTQMFISAMSQMTRRSHAIHVMAYGDDVKNVTSYMLQANSLNSFKPELVPPYVVRGSITQFDDNLAKKTADGGLTVGIASKNFLGIGASRSTSINMLALDLAVMRSGDFSLVPGVNSRNSAAILQEGDGIDGEAAFSKLGINYMTSFSKSDGKTTAVRNLVELSAIELIGKLTKVPYWKCLGVDESNPDVAAEIEDWQDGMGGAEKLAFYIRHLTAIGLLPDDGKPTDPNAFKAALRRYFDVLGVPFTGSFSLALLRAHFAADQNQVMAKLEQAANPTLNLVLQALPVDPGKPNAIRFRVTPSIDASVYCFLRDETGTTARIFPNRWHTQSRVTANRAVDLPAGKFTITAAAAPQSLQCYATRSSMDNALGSALPGGDLSPLGTVGDLGALRNIFAGIAPEHATATIEFSGAGAAFTAKPVGG
ncbi:MAG: DUF4384 domain-containing protein [Dokdonella sp.]|uniref:DUF4384 domain-containing protein n=1 Tax=Dokdonella sp. TaxID=2291710 RepID=UPI0025BF9369|nr:DUF4384 domain-containing protein [Dokdonella sp.]MBZ0222995.1 DUF4384 domain-containing protein [Dokdonella sp.]MCC7256426.1 DUF4384 domain-containing protein [Dokdonella sp.]